MEDRYFLVTLGPTGSGKSVLKTIVSKFFKQIPKSQDSGGDSEGISKLLSGKSKEILVDDIVEGHAHYKQKILNILSGMTDDERINLAKNPTMDQRKNFEQAYWETRKLIDCRQQTYQQTLKCRFKNQDKPWEGFTEDEQQSEETPSVTKYNCEQQNCDTLNDEKLTEALRKGDNITLETQGEKIPTWIFTDFIDKLAKERNKPSYKYKFSLFIHMLKFVL